MSQRSPAAALVAALALSACGGSDDGVSPGASGDGALVVAFSPSAIDRDLWEDWGSGAATYLTATVSPVPSETPHVRVLATGVAFVAGNATVTQVGPESFRASLPHPALAPGTYTGTLTVEICHDLACASPYTLSRSTVPYSVQVHDVVAGLGQITATVEVDGAVVTNVNEVLSPELTTYEITTTGGRVVDLIPSLPFITLSGSCTSPAVMTPGYLAGGWRATISFQPNTVGTGSCELSGRVEGGRTVRLKVNITR